MIQVAIVGGIRLYREGLAQYLGTQTGVAVVATASDRVDGVRVVAELRPDVVVVDMAMPESLLAVREVIAIAPDVKIVALSVPDLERAVIACAEAGIAAYVSRDGQLVDLVLAIRGATRGEMVASPRIAGALVRRVAALAAQRPLPELDGLTAREQEVVRLMDEGLSNKQIAARLSIEVATVKNHVHNILEKLKVGRRAEAVRRWRQARPLQLSESGFGSDDVGGRHTPSI
jgi:DNA-binding NarL/FixJ family response regulator